jgi:hypothetical protein
MGKGLRLVALLGLALAVAGIGCKKKSEAPMAVPPPVVDAGSAAPVDAAAPTPADAAPAETTPAANAEAGPATPSSGGGSLLAGLFGGGAAARAPAPAPAMPNAAVAVVRDTSLALLEKNDDDAFGRAVEAARLSSDLEPYRAQAGSAPTSAQPTAPIGTPPAPDDPDPCATVVPAMMACLAEDLGEAIDPQTIEETLTECRTTFRDWTAGRQAALRACNAVADCSAKIACLGALEEVEVDDGGEETADPGPALPADADFCTRMVVRSAQCMETEMPADVLGPAAEECRKGLTDMPPALVLEMTACLEHPCDQMYTCMGRAGVASAGDEVATTAPGTPEIGDLFPPAPDASRVATLPEETRKLCTELAGALDRCWDTLVATALSAGGAAPDPSMQTMMQEIRGQLLPGMTNICLTAALDQPETFQEMTAARRCIALPCDQMMPCLQEVGGI